MKSISHSAAIISARSLAAAGVVLTLLLCQTPGLIASEPYPTDLCVTNLTKIWRLLEKWVGDGDTFPPALGCLADYTTNRDLFICHDGRHPETALGSLTNVDQWTDYIYFASQRDVPPLYVPILICPPENHGGGQGYVVWTGGKVERLPGERIHALVARPWCATTNATALEIEYLKRDIVVRLPKWLRPFYPDAYSAGEGSSGKK